MRRREGARVTLTNRLLMLAALIVVVTTLLLITTSAVGVYEMARRQQSARLVAYRDMLAIEIGGHLSGAQGAVQAAAGDPAMAEDDPGAFRGVTSTSVLDDAQLLGGMVLLDDEGAVLEEWPPGVLGGQTPASLGASDASPTVTPFIWQDATGGERGGTLWVLARVEVSGGPPRVLMGRLRSNGVEDALADIANLTGSHTAFVFDGSDRLLYRTGEGQPIEGALLEFTADANEPTIGQLRVGGETEMVGPYADIPLPRGLGWKVAVVENPSEAWHQTRSALMPGLLGWAVALLVALAASLAVVSRVTQPLKRLERRARALASGADIEPEAVVEHDEIGRLLEAFNSVVVRLNRLNEIADLLARASDRSLVLAGVTSSIAHMLGPVDVEVLLLDDAGRLEMVAAEGALAGRTGIWFEPASLPWIAVAIDTGQPVEAQREAAEDAFFGLHGPGALCALAAPLHAGTEVIGVAVVVRHTGLQFTEAEAETVRSFAAQASVALQNARLFEEERRSRREAEALRQIAEHVVSAGAVEDVLFDVARMEADLLGFGSSLVVLRDRPAYGLLQSDDVAADRAWLAAWDALPGATADEPDPAYVDMHSPIPRVRRVLEQSEMVGALLTPLYRGAGLAGLLVLSTAEPRAGVAPRHVKLARTVGSQASLALENAYLYQQAKSRADNLETIFRISHAVGSSLQSRIVLNRVLDVVQKILSADAVMLMTYDAQRKYITVPMARGILHRDMLEATFRPGEDVPGRVFETREPERYDRISGSDTQLLNSAAEQGLESLLAVPLLARGRSIGVLVVFAREPGAFSTDELDLLRTFASQAALAIDNAEMFSREHSVSTLLQESILPTRLPRIPGIDASSVYLPAGTDADIGGDYYDLFTAPDGRVVVSIGDVCGKGVAAATKTSMIRYAIRGMVVAGLEPARVLSELNAMLVEAADATSIVTLWLCFIDVGSGVLTYANGGHPPGLLFCPSRRRIERLVTTGALLGAVAGTDWTQREIALEEGATLLLYTDGVTEARNGVRFFGEGRVRRALRAEGSAAAIAQRLLAQVQRFAAGELRDDAAILALAYRPKGSDTGVTPVDDSGK